MMTVENINRNFEVVRFDLQNTIHKNKFFIEKEMYFFGQWQGSAFYFSCNGNENPPVYYLQDFDDITIYKESFTEFLKDEGLIPLLQIIKQDPEWAQKAGISQQDIDTVLSDLNAI